MAINLVKTKKTTIEDWMLLIDSNRGIYIPVSFAKEYAVNLSQTKENLERIQVLLKGPNHEDYWEVWEEVLNETITDKFGNSFTLHQDIDLWAVPTSFDWDTYEYC